MRTASSSARSRAREDVRDCLVARDGPVARRPRGGRRRRDEQPAARGAAARAPARSRDPLDPRQRRHARSARSRDGRVRRGGARSCRRSPARSRARGHGVALARDDAARARPGSARDPVPRRRRARCARFSRRSTTRRHARRRPPSERSCVRSGRAVRRRSPRLRGDDDPSCSSPGPRRVGRWTSDGARRRGGRAAGARRATRRTTRSRPARTAYWRRSVADQPLAGRRIVVTRPEAKPLADELERLGAEVTIVPLIEIRPAEDRRALEDAVARIATYDWIVLTSVNGVAAVGEGLRRARRAARRGRRSGHRRRDPRARSRAGVRRHARVRGHRRRASASSRACAC